MKNTLGLYIHVPFCRHKCGYCDFNSWAETKLEPQRRWLDALIGQLDSFLELSPCKDFEVDTVFMGGGTPSLLSHEILNELSAQLRSKLQLSRDLEFSMECNPEDISEQLLEKVTQAGVGRLSVGIQSFSADFLSRLERQCSPQKNIKALELLATQWKGAWSGDLMYGLPGQSLLQWEAELKRLLEFSPDHISAYQLTLTTPQSKSWQQAPEDALLDFYHLKKELLEKEGFDHYEVSNFAKPAAQCRHNLKYWRLEPFLALGPGAYGLLPQFYFPQTQAQELGSYGGHLQAHANFERWSQPTDFFGAQSRLESRSALEHLSEQFLTGLRLKEGVKRERIEPNSFKQIQALRLDRQLFILDQQGLRVTDKGMEILDFCVSSLISSLSSLSLALDSEQMDPMFRGRAKASGDSSSVQLRG